MEVLETLPRGTLAALELAVNMASEWRGYYVNSPEMLAAFEADMKRMRAALAAVKRQQRAVKRLVQHEQRVLSTAVVH